MHLPSACWLLCPPPWGISDAETRPCVRPSVCLSVSCPLLKKNSAPIGNPDAASRTHQSAFVARKPEVAKTSAACRDRRPEWRHGYVIPASVGDACKPATRRRDGSSALPTDRIDVWIIVARSIGLAGLRVRVGTVAVWWGYGWFAFPNNDNWQTSACEKTWATTQKTWKVVFSGFSRKKTLKT